jgi:general secretion pathway protein A
LQSNPYIRFFSFFGLRENPFTVSPDPRYLFMTGQIQKALDALAYGIQSREGIILLTGEAGTGKTTVINRLLDWLHERRTPTAYIFNSNLEPKHLFDFMLADFGVPPDARSKGNALMCLNQWLSERCRQGEIPVLVVDEGQGLPLHVLDEIRMLLNLETPHEKLLQIVLAGQPELEEKLKRPELRQLKQRIALRCRTGPLTLEETHDYIQARMNIAGAAGKSIFAPEAVNAVHVYSRGIPRVMNLLCEHSLIKACAGQVHLVPGRMVEDVAREFQFDQGAHAPSTPFKTVWNPASIYEPLVTPEASLPPIQALAASVSGPSKAVVPPASAGPLAPSATLAPRDQRGIALPDRNEPAGSPRPANILPVVPAHVLTVHEGSNKIANTTSEKNVASRPQMVAKVAASQTPIVRFPVIRSEVIQRRREFRKAIHHTWAHIFAKHELRRVAVSVTSRVERTTRRLSVLLLRQARSWRLLWRDAGPAWQRMEGSLLQWLEGPLAQRHSWTARLRNNQLIMMLATIASPLHFPHSWQNSRDKFMSAVLPASRLKMKASLLRWLRQPFRPSHLRHPNPRAAGPRDPMSSAL